MRKGEVTSKKGATRGAVRVQAESKSSRQQASPRPPEGVVPQLRPDGARDRNSLPLSAVHLTEQVGVTLVSAEEGIKESPEIDAED